MIWLGVTMFLAKSHGGLEPVTVERKSAKRAFWESVSVEVLNPKTAIFYVAFLPQFADPSAALPIWLQLLVLGTVVNVMFSSADAICVILADKITSILKASGSANRIANRLGGSILVALGVNLAFDKR